MERSRTAIAPKAIGLALCAALAWSVSSATAVAERPAERADQAPTFGVGRAPSPDELKAIDIDVLPDGRGLPPGKSSAASGKEVYTNRCVTCHGPTGVEGPQEVLAGGRGSLKVTGPSSRPLKSVGSYWPYATTVFDYVRRAMPFAQPHSLSDSEVYAVTAYLLSLNGIIGETDVMNAETLPRVKMPNRDNFILVHPWKPKTP